MGGPTVTRPSPKDAPVGATPWRLMEKVCPVRHLANLVVAALLGCLLGGPVAADEDITSYPLAFAAAAAGRFDEATAVVSPATDPLLAKVLDWMRLARPNSGASFAEIAAFVRDNPRWPQPSVLQRRAEEAIVLSTPSDDLLVWFAAYPPITADGRTAFGEALLRKGRDAEGRKALREAWMLGDFGVLQERQFWARHGKLLTAADNVARLDRLLWDMDFDAARRMLPRVDKNHQALANARIALLTMQGGVERAINAVPAELRDDAGLIHARLKWRRQKNLDDSAAELLAHPAANTVRPAAWWTERSIIIRRLLLAGDAKLAYRLARAHGQKNASELAEGEWLAGWIALRFLDDAATALPHFQRLYENTAAPISRARGAYWVGRAMDALKKRDDATRWYGQAAVHVTTFYGQLAAERLGNRPPLPAAPIPPQEEAAAFERDELVRVVKRLAEVGLADQVTPFLLRLNALARTPGGRALTAALANHVQRRDLAVHLARRSDVEGVTMLEPGYPRPPEVTASAPERELILALIRQESGFRHAAVSAAGAHGLMQLLPTTASMVAKAMNVAFSKEKLTQDPEYNVTIGSAHLAKLIADFEGSYVLALAAYNAGPARARAWLTDYGDPRQSRVDAIDWIESIPYAETRNYVQRVLEGLQVYRRFQEPPLPASLEDDLKR